MRPHNIIAALLCLFLASCGTLRLHKHKQLEEHSTQLDSTARKVTVIREHVDTVIRIKPATETARKTIEAVKRGDSVLVDNEHTRVVAHVDDLGVLEVTTITKAREIPVKVDRETTSQEEVHVQRDDRSHKEDTEVSKEREPWLATYLSPMGVVLVVSGLISIIFFLRQKQR